MAYRNMRTKNLIIGSMGAIKPRFVVDQVAFLGRFEEPVMACRNMRTKNLIIRGRNYYFKVCGGSWKFDKNLYKM